MGIKRAFKIKSNESFLDRYVKIGEKFEVCYMYFVTEVDLRNILAVEDGVTKIAL